jgi:hypothetical protein
MSHASGLAAAIRCSTESDTFDLAGQTPATISNNITQAFEEPFPINNMIRITFVTGAGKLARQKYDESAAKAVTTALRDLGFEQDSGASCVVECAGSFKLQHDTGKNLKTVVVFPRIQQSSVLSEDNGQNSEKTERDGDPSSLFLKPGSPEEMIALSPLNMFENLVKSRCPSWSQKKACNVAVSNIQEEITAMEQQLLQGTALNEKEQALYDAVSADNLEQKHNMLKDLMHQQVESGSITDQEKKQLLLQVSERLETLEKEIETATSEKNNKKMEKLSHMKKKLEDRQQMLKKITPVAPAPLKYQNEILGLQNELAPLLKLEESTKGRLLSLKETQNLARKEEILDGIKQLENDSRGWFEDDDSFTIRVERCKAAGRGAQNKSKKVSSSKSTTNTAKKSSSNPWISTASTPKIRAATKTSTKISTSKKSSGGPGGVFAAMMMDDSDDE